MPSMYASPCQSFLNLAEVPQPPAFDKFTLFPDLPVELRIVIWKLAVPEERVIEIHVNKDSNKYFTDTNVPAALHTCRESRELALKEYEVMGFGNEQERAECYKENYTDELRERSLLQPCSPSALPLSQPHFFPSSPLSSVLQSLHKKARSLKTKLWILVSIGSRKGNLFKNLTASSNNDDPYVKTDHEVGEKALAGSQFIEDNTEDPSFWFRTYINYSRDTIYLSHAAAFLHSLAKASTPRDKLQLLAFDKLYGLSSPAQTIHAFRNLRRVKVLVEDDKAYTSYTSYRHNIRKVIRFDKPYCRNDYRFRTYSENDRTEFDDVIYHEHYLGKVNDFKGCLEYCIKLDRFESDGTGNPDDLMPLKEWIDVEFVPIFVTREPNPKMLMPWVLD